MKFVELRDLPKGSIVYVASPLSAKTLEEQKANIENALLYEKCVESINSGVKAIAPHGHLTSFLDDNNARQRKLGMDFGMLVLKQADAIAVFGSKISSGMREEILYALKEGIPIYVVDQLRSDIEALAK